MELYTAKGKETIAKVQSFQQQNVQVPACGRKWGLHRNSMVNCGNSIHTYTQSSACTFRTVPACRGQAGRGPYTATQWSIVVAACLTLNKVQGVGFEREVWWVPPKGLSRWDKGTPLCRERRA